MSVDKKLRYDLVDAFWNVSGHLAGNERWADVVHAATRFLLMALWMHMSKRAPQIADDSKRAVKDVFAKDVRGAVARALALIDAVAEREQSSQRPH